MTLETKLGYLEKAIYQINEARQVVAGTKRFKSIYDDPIYGLLCSLL